MCDNLIEVQIAAMLAMSVFDEGGHLLSLSSVSKCQRHWSTVASIKAASFIIKNVTED